jgi:hypothetical protein
LHEWYKHNVDCYKTDLNKESEISNTNFYVKVITKYHNPFTIIIADEGSEGQELFRELFLNHGMRFEELVPFFMFRLLLKELMGYRFLTEY